MSNDSKDAARYRWLKAYDTPDSVMQATAPIGTLEVFIGKTFIDEETGMYASQGLTPEEVDAAIDLAMSMESK